MGVWIETTSLADNNVGFFVTPCMGVWIETSDSQGCVLVGLSHPVWVCGLKH